MSHGVAGAVAFRTPVGDFVSTNRSQRIRAANAGNRPAGARPRRARSAWRRPPAPGAMLAVALATLLALASTPRASTAAPETGARLTQEYDLKAAFLFNFTKFVEWPADAFDSTSAPFTIGIVGDDPFDGGLDDIVANESVHDRKIVVRRFASADQIGSCQLLFVGEREMRDMARILSALGRRSVLTVGETKAFTDHSGIIAFEMSQRRVRLRINPAAAKAARLTISSQLLRQAEIVGARRAAE
jgi:YfiR/HmsC-like